MNKGFSFVVAVVSFCCTVSLTAQESNFTITNWRDGTSMGCTYIFEPSAVVSWDGQGAPPVTVEDVNRVVLNWVAGQQLSLVMISNYRLALTYDVRRAGSRLPVQAWFIDLVVIPTAGRAPVYRSDVERKLAISFNETIIEPTCD